MCSGINLNFSSDLVLHCGENQEEHFVCRMNYVVILFLLFLTFSYKAPLLHSLMDDNEISILALTETWIRSDDPPVIKNGPAPPGYRILHVHRDSNQPAGSDQTRGGGLALVYQDGIQISPHKHQIIHTSFELQLVNICSPGRDFVLANILSPSFREQVNLSC